MLPTLTSESWVCKIRRLVVVLLGDSLFEAEGTSQIIKSVFR